MKTRANIKIGIVDENGLFKMALIQGLNSEGFLSISESANEEDMLKQLSSNLPDVLLYDFYNSSERFYITIEKIKKVAPKTKLLVLSFENSPEIHDFCFTNGVFGFYHKNSIDFQEMAYGIEKIANGEVILIPTQNHNYPRFKT